MKISYIILTDMFNRKMEWMGENLEINIKMDVDNDRLVIKISETPSGVRKSAEIKLSEISLMQKGITINAVCCDSTKKISN